MSSYTRTSALDWARRIGDEYLTTSFFRWEIGVQGSDLWFDVPAGTPFDVSVPWCLRWLFNPHDPLFLKASVMHDLALRLGWDRVSAAALFSAGLKADGVGRAKRLAMTFGVIAKGFE